ncbi:MAG: HAD-IA family hydrolase [Flavobacteriaceae bacterium]|nr:HAD-IA family hydrolase [Flavobacteriaceae bacterium]
MGRNVFWSYIAESVAIQQKLIADNNYKICALTNWSAEKWEVGKRLFPFLNDFKNIVVSGIEKTIKPLPKIYEILIERYQLNPKKCIFIDDNFDNVKAAKKFGISDIHFQSARQLKEDLIKLEIVF